MTRHAEMRPWIRFPAVLVLGAVFLGGHAPVAAGQEIGDARQGRRIAETWCSGCHDLSRSGESDGPTPAFSAIARMPSTTAMSLRAFLRTPHSIMPNIRLEDAEIDDLAAFILSLRGS